MSDMECYRQALAAFCMAAKSGTVALTDTSSYLRLHLNGTWEITDVQTHNLGAAFYDAGKIVPHGICLPLILPFSEEALMTCLEEKRPLVEVKEQEDAFYRDLYDF